MRYCVNCGTVNRDGAVICEKCDADLEKQRQPQARTAVDEALASRTEIMPHNRGTGWLASRLVMLVLVAVLLVLVPMIIAIRRAVTPGAVSMPASSDTSATGSITLPELGDAVRKQNGKRLQMAVDDFFALHRRYPRSLSEVPPEQLRFTPDPRVYRYTPTLNPPGYRIEVILLEDSVGDHIVSENGVTKMVLRPFVPTRRTQ